MSESLVTINAITQIVGGTQTAWNNTNIIVPLGVVVYAPDTTVIKMGDGVSTYANLPVIATLKDILNLVNTRPGCILTEWPSGAVVLNGAITLLLKAPTGGTITSLDYKVASGSFIVGTFINGTPVTGLQEITVNNAIANNAVATAGNIFNAGDEITFSITGANTNPTSAVLNLNLTWSSH